jgi:hypothetical protein
MLLLYRKPKMEFRMLKRNGIYSLKLENEFWKNKNLNEQNMNLGKLCFKSNQKLEGGILATSEN